MTDASDDIHTEKSMTLEQVMDHRLALAAKHLKWTPVRIAAFRQGYADSCGKVDLERLDLHQDEMGWLESALKPEELDSLGYRDGLEAAEALAEKTENYADKNVLMDTVYYWADNGDNDFEIDEAAWTSDAAADLSPFLQVRSRQEWIDWFVAEHEASIADGRMGYPDLLLQDIIQSVVHVEYPDRLSVWDGYHRIGACMLKGSGIIPAIKGVPAPEPLPTPGM